MGEVEAITPPRQGRWRRRGKSEDENSRDDSGSPSPPLRRKKGISSRPGMMLSKDDSDPSLLKPIKMTGTPTMFRRKRSTGSSAHQEESIPENGELERTKNKFRMFGKLRRGKAKGASTDEEDNNNNVRSAPSRTVSFDFQVDELRASSDHPRSYMTSDAYTPPRGGKAGGGGFSLDCIEGSSPYGGSTTANSTDSMLSYVDPVRSNSFDSSSLHRPGERARYSVHHGSRGGKKKFRVRPYRCFSEPVYMTEEEIYADSLKPSQDFEFLKTYLAPTFRYLNFEEVPPVIEEMWGSPKDDGRIGSLRMEVLGAISLARQKPDVCVYVVCGDTAFTTDVLTGYRSPMWPCQSKRAGVFPIHHAYAKVFIGVFDVKARKNKENDVFCGRIVLDIATLRPDTEYDITFPLRASSFIYDRKPRGVLRLRFSLHWFNERAALFSYFKGPKSITRSSPLADGQPTIPCADPKTFRNLALTIHGQDLPGKYSRVAFRATMREFNLYQQNLRHLVKVLILDAIMYENPFISLYLFLASMHCVYLASIAMVPPYFVGYILILFWLNHRHYISSPDYNLGYRPLTAFEIAKGLLFHSVPGQNNYEAILLHKRTKKRRVKASRAAQKLRRLDSMEGSVASENNDEDGEIEALDHREFPFSERNTYAHFAVEHSLAPSKSNRRGKNVCCR